MPRNEKRSVKKPLTEDDHRTIRRLKNRLAELIPLMDRMERCGMPCEENREVGKRMAEFFDRLEAEFFDGKIPDGQ